MKYMPKRISIEGYLSIDELENHYRQSKNAMPLPTPKGVSHALISRLFGY
jgi:hypothetical protein